MYSVVSLSCNILKVPAGPSCTAHGLGLLHVYGYGSAKLLSTGVRSIPNT